MVDVSGVAIAWEESGACRQRLRTTGQLVVAVDGSPVPKVVQKEVAHNAEVITPILMAMEQAKRDRFGNFSMVSLPLLEQQLLVLRDENEA